MCRSCDPESVDSTVSRSDFLRRAAGAVAGLGVASALAADAARAAPRHDDPPVPGPQSGGSPPAGPLVLESVTGPVDGSQLQRALAHEHLFVDFLGPTDPGYMDVDWSAVTQAILANVQVLRGQGVDLFVDWTNIGVGRNVLLLRDVSRQTGMTILCPTGIYKSLLPAAFSQMTIDDIAGHFLRELTLGVDGTPIRANWIKIATTESGPTPTDARIHRAAARAAKKAGATISLHSPFTDATLAVVETLAREGFRLPGRFIWGHAQPSPVEDHIELAKRGAYIQYDAISAASDPFFNGPTDDESMLDRIEAMVNAGFGDRVMVTADASVYVNPVAFQYDRDNSYVYGTFEPKLRARIGDDAALKVFRDNVVQAFRRGSRVT
jgi:phosphotriesterase-related protein